MASKLVLALGVAAACSVAPSAQQPQGFFRSAAAAAPSPFGSSLFSHLSSLSVEPETTTEPVPILRFVDRHNPDGSYTYGYESGDGTYKIETRHATGEVQGKYGYYDNAGVLREVEYGASPERGFEPRADGLVLPPPTVDASVADNRVERPEPREEVRSVPSAPKASFSAEVDADAPSFANFAPRRGGNGSSGRRVVVRRKKTDNRSLDVDRRAFQPEAVAVAATQAVTRRSQLEAFPAADPVPSVAVAPAVSVPLFDAGRIKNVDLSTGSFSFAYRR